MMRHFGVLDSWGSGIRLRLPEFRIFAVLTIMAIMTGMLAPDEGFSDEIEIEDISFDSGGSIIRGTLYSPVGQGPYPIVLILHGMGGN